MIPLSQKGAGKMRGMGGVWLVALMMALAIVIFINVMSYL